MLKAELVLASASPRRRELLAQIGLHFRIIPSTAVETELAGETPADMVRRLSLSKASEVAGRCDNSARWVIGSDTIVVLEDEVLGKPRDNAHAAVMLRKLSGHSHRVLSGFAVIDRQQQRQRVEAVTTVVRFRQLTEEEIARYIATGEPADKAGAYAIQGIGACFVSGIEGSYSNVVGLPLCRLTLALKELGVPLPI
ncbi:MAG: Maf family protein [Pelovirga sp.]